ncbi:type II secretion system F family protein [Patescibacteria group bacterium]|nr:type II secretion system F family protein [Patescibacteria group bacterium]
MAEFEYKARDTAGSLKTGEITAQSEQNAAELLAEHHLILTRLAPKKESQFDVSRIGNMLHRITMKDKVIFTRQLGTMVKSGLPIVQALHILAEQTSNTRFADIIRDISSQIEGGSNFSNALSKYPKVFDRVYINLVRSGEASGQLDLTLERLATQQEKSYRLVGKVRGAMLYPAFVLVAMAGATILMLVVVIPPLKGIFAESGSQLPLATRILITMSDALLAYWYLFILAAVLVIFGLRSYLASPAGKFAADRLKLRLPIFGPLFKKIYISRMTRTLATLVGGGVPILEALDIVADSVGNKVYANALHEAAKQVEAGVPLSTPLKANPAFPPLVPQMVAVGEQTGKMDQVLTKLADFYDEEVDTVVKNLSTLMEPLIMVILGIGVGGLLVAILMPIYTLGNVIK